MPTTRKRRSRGSVQILNETQKMQLLYDVVLTGWETEAFQTEAEARKAWKKHRDALIEEYIAAKGSGRRPAGFWEFDHEKNLRILGQSKYPCPNGSKEKWSEFNIYEDEWDWLKRHDLLLPGEKPPDGYLEDKMGKYDLIQQYEKAEKKVIPFPTQKNE